MENYILQLIAGGFIIIGVLIAELIKVRRVNNQNIVKARNDFWEELDFIIKAMNEVRTFNSPLEAVGFFKRHELGTVNYTAFLKTCDKRQRKEIEIAYKDYQESEHKYDFLVHLRTLTERIINEK